MDAFGGGRDYPDFIRIVAARASGAGAAVTIAVVNRVQSDTDRREASADG